jgi:two-component system, chemotaxis family, response regulator Rcp1
MTESGLEILLVEDDREQADLIIDTARVCRSTIEWNVVEDGETALSLLRREGAFSHVKRPALVLLDLNLPGLGGIEVLRAVKDDATLRGLPVIVLSSSREPSDIETAYALGVNCYIAKPASFEGLCSLVRFVEAFLALPQADTPSLQSQKVS